MGGISRNRNPYGTLVAAPAVSVPVEQPVHKAAFVPSSAPMLNTNSPVDPTLERAKHDLQARVGQNYNKGGLQYLTDADLLEQRSGTHRRRG